MGDWIMQTKVNGTTLLAVEVSFADSFLSLATGPLYRILPRLPYDTLRYSNRGMGLSDGETSYSHAEARR
jgi:hypothetical protein